MVSLLFDPNQTNRSTKLNQIKSATVQVPEMFSKGQSSYIFCQKVVFEYRIPNIITCIISENY